MSTILYFGDSSLSSTSAHRAHALERLGHTVTILDPYQAFTHHLQSPWVGAVHYRTGYRFLQGSMAEWIRSNISRLPPPDLIWIDGGELFGPKCIRILQEFTQPIVLYNIDDPTGKRDGRRFDLLVKALPLYDLVVVVRKETEQECRTLGAKQVLRVMRSYDEIAHQPFLSGEAISADYRSEVAFIGTWMRYEKRDEFFVELIKQGIPLSIWGGRWQKSPYWQALEPHYRGGVLGGRSYVAAIQGAKICLGMLSKGNRDLHTTRSLEVPYAGGLLCAERTTEHATMYQDGVDAVFWSSVAECVTVCKNLLANDKERERIRLAGMRRVIALKAGNQDICESILTELKKG